MVRTLLAGAVGVATLLLVGAPSAGAAPPQPGGPHPRLFLDTATLDALKVAAGRPDSAVARAVTRCNRIRANPGNFTTGGMGLDFGANMSACALAWKVTADPVYATEAVRFFRALLNDYQAIGDGAGGDDVVRHDTGYAMRGFAPYAAIAYDWLREAPGVDADLLALARRRFKAWTDWYDADGYHNDQPGANYHAGYIFGATMIAIAQGNEAGAEGAELWTHVVDDLFGRDMAAALADGGTLDGGDWLEGWQYGNLSVLEYAASARALRDQGVTLEGYAAWEGELVARAIYASPPASGQMFIGGDADIETPYRELSAMNLYAALIDVGPAEARGWAQHLIETYDLQETTFLLLAALAEVRATAPTPFPTDVSTLLFAPGSHTVYARSGWGANQVWMVTRCLPGNAISDHLFFDAGNLVLSRGPDHLIVDPSPYGSMSSLTGNAPTLSSNTLLEQYRPGQGPWGSPANVGFAWRRQSRSGVVATRCEYSGQFKFRSDDERAPDVTRAVRDLVLVPTSAGTDATLVVIDYAAGGNGPLLLRYRTQAALAASGSRAAGTLGASRLTIQAAAGPAGTVRDLPQGDCFEGQTRGNCDVARFAGDEWRTSVAGTTKRAITVIDAASGDAPAALVTAGTGFEVVGTERGGHWIAVVTATTPSAGTAVAAPLTYRTRAGVVATHVVVDAPRGDGGRSDVTARMVGDECEVTVMPRAGATGGFDGRPLMLAVSATCAVAEDPDLGPFEPPSPPDPGPGTGWEGAEVEGGCCDAGGAPLPALVLVLVLAPLVGRRAGRRAERR